MKFIRLKAHAKINLCLDVVRKREDGYHDLSMIMQAIGLHDDIIINPIKTKCIQIACNNIKIPFNQSNTAYKAAQLILDSYNIDVGIRITIRKRIPVCAGLGGGSSDAAAVIMGLDKLFNIGMSQDQMICLGKKIGSDVPFFFLGGTALAEGTGTILTKLDNLNAIYMLVIKPKRGISTPSVYKQLRVDKIQDRPNVKEMISAISNNDIKLIIKNLKNVLEPIATELCPVISEIRAKMANLGSIGCLLCGSGSAVFGLFNSFEAAQYAYDNIGIIPGEGRCFLTYTI